MEAIVYDTPLTLEAVLGARGVSSDAGAPPAKAAELDAQFLAAQARNATERATREKETLDAMKTVATVFDAAFPGAGRVLLFAYGATLALGAAIAGRKDWNTPEAKARLRVVLERYAGLGLDPKGFSGDLYFGAEDYAESLEGELVKFNYLTEDEKLALKTLADARFGAALRGDRTYLDLMTGTAWSFSPFGAWQPYTAYMLAAAASSAFGAPFDAVKTATLERWEAQATTDRAGPLADWGGIPASRSWTDSRNDLRRYIDLGRHAWTAASSRGVRKVPLLPSTPTLIPTSSFVRVSPGTPPFVGVGGTGPPPAPPKGDATPIVIALLAGAYLLMRKAA